LRPDKHIPNKGKASKPQTNSHHASGIAAKRAGHTASNFTLPPNFLVLAILIPSQAKANLSYCSPIS